MGSPSNSGVQGILRVAHVMGKMAGGGVESVVMNYYRHIDRNIVQFDFIVDDNSLLVPRDEIERLGGRVFRVPPLSRGVRSYEKALRNLFEQEGWIIVHSHVNALSVFPLGVAKRCGVPVRIAHSHSASGKGEYLRNAVKAILKTRSNRYPTHRMACSRYAGEWLFGENANFDILYNAIELDRFSFDAKAREKARADLGIVGNPLVVGHVGRFMAQKNHGFLLSAFSEVVKRQPDSILLLIGSGGSERSARSWVVEHGLADNVMFLGQRNDVDKLYQAFDVFALPSLYEGLGIVGIEAQRAGLPCLLSNEITREVNVTGNVEFLPIEDPILWADAITAARSRSRIPVQPENFSNYEIESAARRLTDRYAELMPPHRSQPKER